MKFKDYLDKVLDNAFMVEEWCGNQLIARHTAFGLGDEVDMGDGEVADMTNLFQLWEDGNCGEVTEIDINQEISVKGQAVVVKDILDNVLELFFYTGEIIPHPTLDNEPKSL